MTLTLTEALRVGAMNSNFTVVDAPCGHLQELMAHSNFSPFIFVCVWSYASSVKNQCAKIAIFYPVKVCKGSPILHMSVGLSVDTSLLAVSDWRI